MHASSDEDTSGSAQATDAFRTIAPIFARLGVRLVYHWRRGRPSRFWFYVSSVGLGKEVSGKGKPAVRIIRPPKMLTHRFRLRPELEISLELPSDLTQKEVGRVADFLKTLPFEGAALGRAA
jgi:hypothetical protein